MPGNRPTVLIVEDNVLIAMEVEALAEECGCDVAATVGTINEALQIVRDSPPDAAVLDINLGDDRVWPLADALEERNVPFVLASGYQVADLPDRFRDRPLLSKPLSRQSLDSALRAIGTIS